MERKKKSALITRISDIIDIAQLERENRNYLYFGFAVAVAFHALLFTLVTYERVKIVQVTGKVVELRLIETILTEPLTITKRTFQKKQFQRRAFRYRPPSGRIGTSVPPEFNSEYELPPVDIRVKSPEDVMMPGGVDIDIGASRAPDDRIPLKNRVFDDPGEYRAEIIYNPDDKWAIQGFVHIPIVKTSNFIPNDTFRLAVFGLAEAVNRMTNITAVVDNPQEKRPIVHWSTGYPLRPLKENPVRGLTVDSLFVKRPPVVYILTDRAFELTPAETGSFRRYIASGGIVILENARPGNAILGQELKSLLKEMVGGYCPWVHPAWVSPGEIKPAYEKIPDTHPVYHCFYDFEATSPEGTTQEYGAIPYRMKPYLEGLWFGDRLVAIYSDRGYGLMWYADSGNREQRRMGVNLVIFALLQRKGYHKGEWFAYKDVSH